MIKTPPRSKAGYRLFSEHAVKRVRFIKRAQALGFSLLQIQDLLSLRQNSLNARQEIQQKTIEKIDLVSQKIDELQKITHVLLGLVECCKGQESIDACPIIDALESESHLDERGPTDESP